MKPEPPVVSRIFPLLQGVFLAIAVILICTVTTSTALSKESEEPEKEKIPLPSVEEKEKIPLPSVEYDTKVDTGHKEASETLVNAAKWLDSFFDDPRFLQEENKTRARVKFDFGYSENDDFDFSSSFSLDLKVPRLSKKINLFISVEEDEDFEIDSNPISDAPRHEDSDQDRFTAGLQYFFSSTDNFNISSTFGFSIDYAYAGVRLRYLSDFGSWQGRFANRVRYYTDDGWENKTSYDLERHFSAMWLFRATATGFWYENEDGYSHSFHLRLYQILSEERALMYEIGHYYETDPDYTLVDQQFRIRYRQKFYRDWLTIEVAPQITFPKDYDRDANFGIVFRLEAEFGYHDEKNRFGRVKKF